MNRYPLWKYAILAIALAIGLVFTAPNFFGEAPAVQVSSAKVTVKLDSSFAPRVQQVLEQAGLKPDFVQFDGNSVKARLDNWSLRLTGNRPCFTGTKPSSIFFIFGRHTGARAVKRALPVFKRGVSDCSCKASRSPAL